MKLEGTIHCEGPDCGAHQHVGARTVELNRLPVGWVKLIWFNDNGCDDISAYCGSECAMKSLAKLPPPEEFPVSGAGE